MAKTPKKTKLVPKVRSLFDLRYRSKGQDAEAPRYAQLACLASANLGGPREPLDACLRWLDTNAVEVDERSVVDEINFCRDLVK
jgi:hypothetical protein